MRNHVMHHSKIYICIYIRNIWLQKYNCEFCVIHQIKNIGRFYAFKPYFNVQWGMNIAWNLLFLTFSIPTIVGIVSGFILVIIMCICCCCLVCVNSCMFFCRQCSDKGAPTKQKTKTIKSSKKKKQPHRLMPGVEVSHVKSKIYFYQ